MWVEIILFLFLGICALIDGLRREIPLAIVVTGILLAVIFRAQGVIGAQEPWMEAALTVLPGVMFWMLSFVTGEKVGYGDGWMLVMIGLFVGLGRCILILMVGLISESIAVLLLLAVKRITGDRQVPFAPFLLLGMGVAICF